MNRQEQNTVTLYIVQNILVLVYVYIRVMLKIIIITGFRCSTVHFFVKTNE